MPPRGCGRVRGHVAGRRDRAALVRRPRGKRTDLLQPGPTDTRDYVRVPATNLSNELGLVAFTAGGIVANGIAAAFSLALWRWLSWGQAFWLTAALVNGSHRAGQPRPVQFQIRQGPVEDRRCLDPPGDTVGDGRGASSDDHSDAHRAFRGLWLSIGDTQILRLYLLGCGRSVVSARRTGPCEGPLRRGGRTSGVPAAPASGASVHSCARWS